jgi:CheY-like chemotaxis protein
MMPEMDGIDTAIELAKNFNLNEVKFIFLTNYGEDNPLFGNEIDGSFAKQIGALAYFRKSEALENLLNFINNFLKDNIF